VLFRAVDIGAELFAITAACVRAHMLAKRGNKNAVTLADLFCREARLRVDTLFDRFFGKNDVAIYKIAQQVMRGEHPWLEEGGTAMVGEEVESKGESAAEDRSAAETAGAAR